MRSPASKDGRIKIAYVGRGSYSWTPNIIRDIVFEEGLEGILLDIRLVDIELNAAETTTACRSLSCDAWLRRDPETKEADGTMANSYASLFKAGCFRARSVRRGGNCDRPRTKCFRRSAAYSFGAGGSAKTRSQTLNRNSLEMSQEVDTYGEPLADIVERTEAGGADVQRYIVAPGMLEMIGSVSGNSVLDLYCGAGYLSRRLAALGANVTAVDSSERLIGIAAEINKREKNNIRYAVAEPTDLSVIEDSTFDDIVCNMGLMLTRDLGGTVAELARLIKLGGRLIFSHVHPCFCNPDAAWVGGESGGLSYITVGSYFTETWWTPEVVADLRDARTKVKHRSLSTVINALSARGFNVRRMSEPRPTPEAIALKPQLEIYDRIPVIVIVEAVFPFL